MVKDICISPHAGEPMQLIDRVISLVKITASKAFFDRGGIIASVIKSSLIRLGDTVIPPEKKY